MQVQSTMLPLGTLAPDFELPDMHLLSGIQSFQDLKGEQGTWIMFWCNHCPFVRHIQSVVIQRAQYYIDQGIGVIAISSNDAGQFPEDGPQAMKVWAQTHAYPFPYLYDASQNIARAYQAACTPDFYLFDANDRCVYRGRFDASTPHNEVSVTGIDLCTAIDQLLEGQVLDTDQYPSIGCNIKWRAVTESS
ncbi:MAG: thioredoxin family protein [Legionellales bacterium]|nr:thioredoxin family protein [Legionellales bacterium]|tara:strand:+ start:228 stop:800 length:573 start_codon:yes stop_codon:yes gene_type:complete